MVNSYWSSTAQLQGPLSKYVLCNKAESSVSPKSFRDALCFACPCDSTFPRLEPLLLLSDSCWTQAATPADPRVRGVEFACPLGVVPFRSVHFMNTPRSAVFWALCCCYVISSLPPESPQPIIKERFIIFTHYILFRESGKSVIN